MGTMTLRCMHFYFLLTDMGSVNGGWGIAWSGKQQNSHSSVVRLALKPKSHPHHASDLTCAMIASHTVILIMTVRLLIR